MFRRPSYRKRVILACSFAFVGQSTAVLVINNYGPTLYAALGYGTRDQLALQCGWITVGIVFNAVGALIMVSHIPIYTSTPNTDPTPGSSWPQTLALDWSRRMLCLPNY